MEKYLVLYIFAYLLYIFAFTIVNFFVRKKAIINRQVKLSHFRSYLSEGPEHLEILKNHFSNQFQVPVLFFITCIISIQFQTTTPLTLILSGIFILSRVIHAYIHLTYNNVVHRALIFSLGGLTIGALWIEILYSIF